MPGSKKRVGFVITNAPQLKLVLPIINKMLNSYHSYPVLFVSSTYHRGVKKNQNYKSEYNPFHDKVEIHDMDTFQALGSVIHDANINIVIMESFLESELMRAIKKSGALVFYLQHSHDVVSVFPYSKTFDEIMLFDKFLLFSDYWAEEMINSYRKNLNLTETEVKLLEARLVSVGFPELDQLQGFDKNQILEKHNLPKDKNKIIFFDPIGYVHHVPNFYYKYCFKPYGTIFNKIKLILKDLKFDFIHHFPHIWKFFPYFIKRIISDGKPINYKKLFDTIKRICLDNDYLLVTKSRLKNNDPDFIKSGVDYYTYDKEYYPYTFLELLFISDVYIGFNSTAVLEAVKSDLPLILFNIFPFNYQYAEYGSGVYKYLEKQSTENESWLNFKEVSENYNWDDGYEDLKNKLVNSKVSVRQSDKYLNKFISINSIMPLLK